MQVKKARAVSPPTTETERVAGLNLKGVVEETLESKVTVIKGALGTGFRVARREACSGGGGEGGGEGGYR